MRKGVCGGRGGGHMCACGGGGHMGGKGGHLVLVCEVGGWVGKGRQGTVRLHEAMTPDAQRSWSFPQCQPTGWQAKAAS